MGYFLLERGTDRLLLESGVGALELEDATAPVVVYVQPDPSLAAWTRTTSTPDPLLATWQRTTATPDPSLATWTTLGA